ncbi:MAG: hypothetical protein KAR11_08445, partial [Phycisphaerae bacterium]|nr:hypothetical protein [Phycisphaerae bacterium]
PAANVVDPTGAGDCFAGGMMGYLADTDAASNDDNPETVASFVKDLKRAIAFGTIVASIELEDFSLNRLLKTARTDIDARLDEFLELTSF